MSWLVIAVTTSTAFLPKLEHILIILLVIPCKESTHQEGVIIIIALIIIIGKGILIGVLIYEVVWHLLQVVSHPQLVLPLLLFLLLLNL
jgi:hypothetical protein